MSFRSKLELELEKPSLLLVLNKRISEDSDLIYNIQDKGLGEQCMMIVKYKTLLTNGTSSLILFHTNENEERKRRKKDREKC